MLGLSDASDMFDISGTMWMVSLLFCVWNEKYLDSLAMAGIQPGIQYDVPVKMVAPIQCQYRCGMAGNTIWIEVERSKVHII